MELFDRGTARGLDLSFDSYPYLAAMSTLMAQLPGWTQTGSFEEQCSRLLDPPTRERIIEALDVTGSDGFQGHVLDWSNIILSDVPGSEDLDWAVGISLAEAAHRVGKDCAEFCLDVLLATGLGATCIMNIGHEHNVRALISDPRHTVGTDGILVGSRPHPRSWASFPRVLEQYVKHEGALSLPEAIRHFTSAPAARLGLTDRGRLAPGAKADLVIMDWDNVRAHATFTQPRQRSEGITDVMINGEFVLRDRELTASRPGQVV